jgi:alpha-glucosidase (family GH31 glycosyl hydrolase)
VIASTEAEDFTYMVQFSPFRIVQKYLGKTRMIVNHRDSLYFENIG